MDLTRTARRHAATAVTLALTGVTVLAACGAPSLPVGRDARAPLPAGEPGQVPAPAPAAPHVPGVNAPAAPAVSGPHAPAPRVAPAIVTDDRQLVVPGLFSSGAATRAPWQAPDVPRRAYTGSVERWRPLVRQVLAEEWQAGTLDGPAQKLDDDIILAVIQQESRGNPKALSPVGAMGLMQVMPRTFAIMMAGDAAAVPAIDPDAFWDEGTNIRAGVRYLALAMQYNDGNPYWALASYNAGIAAAMRWRLAGLYAVPPTGGYTETANYAQIILHNYLAHRPGLEMYVPDPMPAEHLPGALALIAAYRASAGRGA